MMDADYSQIEYRVLTALAGNDFLAELFANPDSDYHTLMASLMYGVPYAAVTPAMRSAAKSFNFGIPYGMGYGSLAILLTGKNTPETRDEAREKYDMYFENQPRTRQFFNNIKEMAQVNGYTKTLFNRYRYYSFTDKDGNVDNSKKAAALRQAGNAVIQGCIDGDTRIQTKEYGIVKIKRVVDKRLTVWDGNKWSLGDITYSGKKQKCIVTFSNGQKFICSPIHKFLVKSNKGNTRFVECKELRGSDISTNPHRVMINNQYEKSDWKYSSDSARKYYASRTHNARNVFLDDIKDSFRIGVVLGRLASDGSILDREVGGSHIRQIIAEHEYNIIPELKKYMANLECTERNNEVREHRNEKITYLDVYSKSIVKEIKVLDIKHKIHDNIFMDTELLRGFLRGFFDGDGGVAGKIITLTFGTQYNFEEMCKDIQKALLFFGIRSRYHKYDTCHRISIKTNDNERFLDLIGFINTDKQIRGRELKCIKQEKLFGKCLVVQSVEITDEYIDMYDVCNTDEGYYVADGIITHNTAADIFKIGVARNFNFIRKNRLFGLMLIINMVHDEQLMEVNVQELNMQRILAEVGKNMQFRIEGFPPLYIGAGIGPAWGYAKGKMAEIHPDLLDALTKEAESIPIRREDTSTPVNTQDVLDYFDSRVYEFRRKKVADYLVNPENWNQIVHPAIGSLINLQFNYGRGDEAKSYIGPNGETYTDAEFLNLNISDFIKENNLNVKPEWFKASELKDDKEVDKEYTDGDEEDDGLESLLEGDEEVSRFTLLDESNKLFGASIQDIISIFGCCILKEARVCGINTKNLGFRKKDAIIDFLMKYLCEKEDKDAMQIVFLKDNNVLSYTGYYVKGITSAELDKMYNSNREKQVSYAEGDIDNRSQAK